MAVCRAARTEQSQKSCTQVQTLVSTLRLYPPLLQCRAPQEGHAAAEGKILLLELPLMVEPVLFSQSHCYTGWQENWEDIHVSTLCLLCPVWTEWCFLRLLKTLCIKYFFLNQYLYRETKSQTVSTLAQGLQTKRGGITISEQVFQLSGEGPLNLIKLAFLAGLNQKKI